MSEDKRTILHVVCGDKNWQPADSELQALCAIFQQAVVSPDFTTIVTRSGVHTSLNTVEETDEIRLIKIEVPDSQKLSEIFGASVQRGRYQHYKGGNYVVTDVAVHSDTNTRHVVFYTEGQTHKVWIRPVEEFLDTVEHEGVRVKRFTKVG